MTALGCGRLRGILTDQQIEQMVKLEHNGSLFHGGMFRTVNKKFMRQISLYLTSLIGTPSDPTGKFKIQRYLAANCIMLGFEGVPAFYLNAMFATGNDVEAVIRNCSNRAINRHKWSRTELEKRLKSSNNIEKSSFKFTKKLISTRKCNQLAFHPNATQSTLYLESCFFGIWRQSIDRSQSIFAITNVTHLEQSLNLSHLNLVFSDIWFDLISVMK